MLTNTFVKEQKKTAQWFKAISPFVLSFGLTSLAHAAVSPATKTHTLTINQTFSFARDSANITLFNAINTPYNETRLRWGGFFPCFYQYFEPRGVKVGADASGRGIFEVSSNNPLPNGAKNIAFVMDVKDKPRSSYTPVNNARTVFPIQNRCSGFADYNLRYGLVKPRNLASSENINYPTNMTIYLGDIVVRRVGLFTTQYTFNETLLGRHQVYLQVVGLGTQVKTCSLNSSNNQTIDLGSITKQSLEASTGAVSGNSSGNNQANFSLNCAAGEGVSVYATISDANSPMTSGASLSTNLDGVGVALTRETNLSSGFVPVQLGPKSSIQGNPNQFKISNSGTATPFIRIRGQYLKTAPTVDVGTVNAQALITFSYQ